MNKFNAAINEIKKIECPTGELEQRVACILVDYNLTDKGTIVVKEDLLDSNELKLIQLILTMVNL